MALFVAVPNVLAALPLGGYGVTFDMFSTKIRADPPHGWGASGGVYARIGQHSMQGGLVDHDHAQHSVYQGYHISAATCWTAMVGLRDILPIGVFASCVNRVQMFSINHVHEMICENVLRLGGVYSPHLLGPTPHGLIPAGVPANVLPANTNLPPPHCRDTVASRDPANWRT